MICFAPFRRYRRQNGPVWNRRSISTLRGILTLTLSRSTWRRHAIPQTLLATHLNGQPLTVEHGAPLRLLVPVKLGLKNVKAITRITYSAEEPRDYWARIWVFLVRRNLGTSNQGHRC